MCRPRSWQVMSRIFGRSREVVLITLPPRSGSITRGRRAQLLQFPQQACRHRRDVVDGSLEGVGVLARRLAVAADLADELQGGRANLLLSGRNIWDPQLLDAATHVRC